jgi:ATP-dependent helicase/nuclease subunit A
MNLAPAQFAAITQRGTHLLLAASAGSGKTEVLARRVVALIADRARPCAVGRLLVVTFTRAAAAELRVRIGRMLRAEAEACTVPDAQANLRRQAVLLDAADRPTSARSTRGAGGWCASTSPQRASIRRLRC